MESRLLAREKELRRELNEVGSYYRMQAACMLVSARLQLIAVVKDLFPRL